MGNSMSRRRSRTSFQTCLGSISRKPKVAEKTGFLSACYYNGALEAHIFTGVRERLRLVVVADNLCQRGRVAEG